MKRMIQISTACGRSWRAEADTDGDTGQWAQWIADRLTDANTLTLPGWGDGGLLVFPTDKITCVWVSEPEGPQS